MTSEKYVNFNQYQSFFLWIFPVFWMGTAPRLRHFHQHSTRTELVSKWYNFNIYRYRLYFSQIHQVDGFKDGHSKERSRLVSSGTILRTAPKANSRTSGRTSIDRCRAPHWPTITYGEGEGGYGEGEGEGKGSDKRSVSPYKSCDRRGHEVRLVHFKNIDIRRFGSHILLFREPDGLGPLCVDPRRHVYTSDTNKCTRQAELRKPKSCFVLSSFVLSHPVLTCRCLVHPPSLPFWSFDIF